MIPRSLANPTFRFVTFIAAALATAQFSANSRPLSAQESPEYIRVVSWNIGQFGSNEKKEYNRSLLGLANIIRKTKADLLCLQGFIADGYGDSLAAAQLKRLVDCLNLAADFDHTPSYRFFLCKPLEGKAVAFVWRRPVTLESEPKVLEDREQYGFRDDGPKFKRSPMVALFSAGNSDFYVVNCLLNENLKQGDKNGRTSEYAALSEWVRKLEEGEEKDAILIGTFNRFVGGKEPWKSVMEAEEEGLFRLPLLDAIRSEDKSFDRGDHEPPADKFSTTVGRKFTLRDQVIISRGMSSEFKSAEPKFGEDVGIVDFDNDDHYKWAVGSWSDAASVLSDHRPIWIRLAINGEDDD